MKDDFIIYRDQGHALNVIDPRKISHTDDLSPIMKIAGDVMTAGYQGVVVDECQLPNGAYLQALNVDLETHEGEFVNFLCKVDPAELPSSEVILRTIKRAYATEGEEF